MLWITRCAIIVGIVFASGGPAAAFAAESSGAFYGEHVVACTQTMGLDGVHNPGMHRGFSGWEGGVCVHS